MRPDHRKPGLFEDRDHQPHQRIVAALKRREQPRRQRLHERIEALRIERRPADTTGQHQPFHAAFLEIVEQRAEGLEAVMGINPRHRCLDAIEGDADRVGIGLGQRLGHGAAPGQDRQFSGHGAQPPGVR